MKHICINVLTKWNFCWYGIEGRDFDSKGRIKWGKLYNSNMKVN